jgi:hypothetical protein
MKAILDALAYCWRHTFGQLYCRHVWRFDDSRNPPPCPCCGYMGPAWQRCALCGAARRLMVLPRVMKEQ